MNYSEPLSQQVIVFVRGVGLGVLFGMLYEFFSVLRNLLSQKKWAYILFDILYSIIVTLISFFFMIIFNSGIVRLNLVFAQLIGGVAFHFSVGRYIIKPLMYAGTAVRKAVSFLFLPIKIFAVKLRKLIHSGVKKVKKEKPKEFQVKKERKKIKNIIKIPLKK